MRIHRLDMTAFGPYAGTEVLDFEALNDAGLFLLTGPTGAGKTTILDAVCFALYGVVPGERGTRGLRSDHAPVDRRPEVVLEATIGERRLRVRRSPEWRRPKRRGSGETTEHASATLVLLGADGTERLVSSRAAEVGHELQQALGMSSEQFLQVALLPQGGFQAFLQASSDERQAVLQKLFRTQRFSRIEEWMRDRTKDARTGCAAAEREVAQVLATVAHRSGAPLPPELASERLGDVSDLARDWARARQDAADAEAGAAATRHRQLLAAETVAREADELVARRLADAERARSAREALAALRDTEGTAREAERRLGDHDAARLVAPLLRGLPALEARCRSAEERAELLLARARSELAPLPAELRDGDLSEVRSRVDERLGRLRALLPREKWRLSAAHERQRVAARLAAARRVADGLTDRVAELPAHRDALVREVAGLRPLVDGLDQTRAAHADAVQRHACAAALPAALGVQERAHRVRRETRDAAADARERHLDAVERRLGGMAAELAGQLEPGEPCQVCGSRDHPLPAQASSRAVDEAEQERALRAHEAAQRRSDEALEDQRRADREVERLTAGAREAGTQEATELLAECSRHLAAAETAARRLPTAETALTALLAEDEALGAEHRRATEVCTTLEADLVARDAAATAAAAEVAAATADLLAGAEPHRQRHAEEPLLAPADVAGLLLTALVARLEAAAEAASAAVTAGDELAGLRQRLVEAREAAASAASSAGFDSVGAAAAAVLPDREVSLLQAALARRADERRAAVAVLADLHPGPARDTGDPSGRGVHEPEAGADTLDQVTPADRVRSRAALAAAVAASATAAALVGATEERQRDVAALRLELDRVLTAWEPLRAERDVTESLSSLVRGTSADNQLQVRLSSYVLATRLDQVLAAANERLTVMRDQRYTLRRCARDGGPGRGGASRAGLGLEVLDAWTGESRAPSTLSGGETFVVSLALALGLADVVGEESGGLSVGTLFVDEGFGMLDPDTLDDVMDRIDALRAGGRTVGVVSHVTELRARIPTQVHVTTGRDGSTLRVQAPDLLPA